MTGRGRYKPVGVLRVVYPVRPGPEPNRGGVGVCIRDGDGLAERAIRHTAHPIVVLVGGIDERRESALRGLEFEGAYIDVRADLPRHETLIRGEIIWRAEHSIIGRLERRAVGKQRMNGLRAQGRRAADRGGATTVPVRSLATQPLLPFVFADEIMTL